MNTYYISMRGAYAVATELSRRECVVCVTPGNAQAVDLLVFGNAGQVSCGVEVKASASPKWEKDWFISSELFLSPSYFYTFVRFEDNDRPPGADFYVVPSLEVEKRYRRVKDPYIRLKDVQEFKNAWDGILRPKRSPLLR